LRIARKHSVEYYEGVILAHRESKADREFLESLGIQVGLYSPKANGYTECIVSLEAMEKLDCYWGKFYWSLHEIEET